MTTVATREGGVDRNAVPVVQLFQRFEVATREGGVDRNSIDGNIILRYYGSPPARVAWIETSL